MSCKGHNEVLPPVHKAWDEESFDRFKKVLAEFTFLGPLPIKMDASLDAKWGHCQLMLSMRTVGAVRGEETFGMPVTIYFAAQMINYFKDTDGPSWEAQIRTACRTLWLHEFDEWLKRDGVPVSDPHKFQPLTRCKD